MTEDNGPGILSELKDIREAVLILNDRIRNQEERLANLERSRQAMPEVQPTASTPAAQPGYANPATQPAVHPSGYMTASQQPNVSQPVAKNQASNLEEDIGGKLFARIGIVALVLGVSFFLKYAFDNNWIGPAGRVAIGILSGVILLGLGEKFIRKYFGYGQILAGGGIAVLYLSIFSAFDFYHLIGQAPAFLFMVLITAAAIVLSLRYNAVSLILVATIGGFATPFLLSSGTNNQWALFSYITLLNSAILIISLRKKWRELSIFGYICTFITVLAWGSEYYTESQLSFLMTFITLYFIMFSVSALAYNLVKKETSSGIEQSMTILIASTYFAVSYFLLDQNHSAFLGFFSLIMALYYLLWAYVVKAITPDDKNLYHFLAFLTVGFVTLAIPIQFDQKIVTIGWTIEGVLLFLLSIKNKETEARILAILLFSVAIFHLLVFDSNYDNGALNILNKTMAVYIFVIIACYFLVYVFRNWASETEEGKTFDAKTLVAIFAIVASSLTIFIVSKEINYYFQQQIATLRHENSQQLKRANELSAGRGDKDYQQRNVYSDRIKKLENSSSTALSIWWLIYGVILIGVGIIRKSKAVRIGGLALFMLAILKLFFYDLWNLGTLYRIVSSISLGVVLLSISFAYQRYKDKIKEII